MWLQAAVEKLKKNYTMNFRIISVSSSDEQFQNYQEDQNPVSSSYVTRQ